MKFAYIPVGKIYKKNNVRHEEETELADLSESIDRFDLIQPIVVRPIGTRFEIVIGHRRFLALKAHGDLTVPCIIRDDIDDRDRIYIQLSENTQRKQMSARELVETFDRLKAATPGLTNGQIGAMIGRSATWVQNQYVAIKLAGTLEEKGEKIDGLTAGQIIGRAERSGVTGANGGRGGRARKWDIRRTGACTINIECPDEETARALLVLIHEFRYRGSAVLAGVTT